MPLAPRELLKAGSGLCKSRLELSAWIVKSALLHTQELIFHSIDRFGLDSRCKTRAGVKKQEGESKGALEDIGRVLDSQNCCPWCACFQADAETTFPMTSDQIPDDE